MGRQVSNPWRRPLLLHAALGGNYPPELVRAGFEWVFRLMDFESGSARHLPQSVQTERVTGFSPVRLMPSMHCFFRRGGFPANCFPRIFMKCISETGD